MEGGHKATFRVTVIRNACLDKKAGDMSALLPDPEYKCCTNRCCKDLGIICLDLPVVGPVE